MELVDFPRETFTRPAFLVVWVLLVIVALDVLVRVPRLRNPEIGGLMIWIWTFMAGYSARKQLVQDSLWRRGFRFVAHCYSSCGAGERTGVLIAAGLLSLGS